MCILEWWRRRADDLEARRERVARTLQLRLRQGGGAGPAAPAAGAGAPQQQEREKPPPAACADAVPPPAAAASAQAAPPPSGGPAGPAAGSAQAEVLLAELRSLQLRHILTWCICEVTIHGGCLRADQTAALMLAAHPFIPSFHVIDEALREIRAARDRPGPVGGGGGDGDGDGEGGAAAGVSGASVGSVGSGGGKRTVVRSDSLPSSGRSEPHEKQLQ